MRALRVLLLVAMLAGCSDPGPRTQEFTGDDEPARASTGGAHEDNTTKVWDHVVVWQLDADPAATTMVVPGNLSGLWLEVTNNPTAPCGANAGTPPDTPLDARVDFTSPSGTSTRVFLTGDECRAGSLVVFSSFGGQALDSSEAGTWQVTFAGRGYGFEQHLFVEGQKA